MKKNEIGCESVVFFRKNDSKVLCVSKSGSKILLREYDPNSKDQLFLLRKLKDDSVSSSIVSGIKKSMFSFRKSKSKSGLEKTAEKKEDGSKSKNHSAFAGIKKKFSFRKFSKDLDVDSRKMENESEKIANISLHGMDQPFPIGKSDLNVKIDPAVVRFVFIENYLHKTVLTVAPNGYVVGWEKKTNEPDNQLWFVFQESKPVETSFGKTNEMKICYLFPKVALSNVAQTKLNLLSPDKKKLGVSKFRKNVETQMWIIEPSKSFVGYFFIRSAHNFHSISLELGGNNSKVICKHVTKSKNPNFGRILWRVVIPDRIEEKDCFVKENLPRFITEKLYRNFTYGGGKLDIEGRISPHSAPNSVDVMGERDEEKFKIFENHFSEVMERFKKDYNVEIRKVVELKQLSEDLMRSCISKDIRNEVSEYKALLNFEILPKYIRFSSVFDQLIKTNVQRIVLCDKILDKHFSRKNLLHKVDEADFILSQELNDISMAMKQSIENALLFLPNVPVSILDNVLSSSFSLEVNKKHNKMKEIHSALTFFGFSPSIKNVEYFGNVEFGGIKNGIGKEFTENGEVKYIGLYEKGVTKGIGIRFSPQGKITHYVTGGKSIEIEYANKVLREKVFEEIGIIRQKKENFDPTKIFIPFHLLTSKNDVVLGVGGYGRVLLYEFNEELVALKVFFLDSKFQTVDKVLRKEVERVRSLSHPNVIRVFGYTQISEREIGVVLEYMKGGDFHALTTKEETRLSNNQKWGVIKKMVGVIAFLHSKGIIHGDIKPANFLLSNQKDACSFKISDFGLSKLLEASSSQTKGAVGSVRFFSPEIAGGFPRLNEKTDMWALGMTIYQLLFGRIPFHEVSNELLCIPLIIKGTLPEFPKEGFSEVLANIFLRCCTVDPENRISAKDLLKIMEEKEEEFCKSYPPQLQMSNQESWKTYQEICNEIKNDIIGSYNWRGKVLKIGVGNILYYDGIDFEYEYLSPTAIECVLEDGCYVMVYFVKNEILKIYEVDKKPKHCHKIEGKFKFSDWLNEN